MILFGSSWLLSHHNLAQQNKLQKRIINCTFNIPGYKKSIAVNWVLNIGQYMIKNKHVYK